MNHTDTACFKVTANNGTTRFVAVLPTGRTTIYQDGDANLPAACSGL